MPDWDAIRYHQLSLPQVGWGRKVLARLDPQPGERILDIGCGTGRLTSELALRTGVLVVGVDASAAMLQQAIRPQGEGIGRVAYVRADGATLPFQPGVFDAVFSAATFHWITDHERLFRSIWQVLKPGGRLVAQSGGGRNLERLLQRTHSLMDASPYARHFAGWSDPWVFAGVNETRARVQRAGFVEFDVSIEESPTTLDDATAYMNFISCVCVRHHVDRLPPADRAEFVRELATRAAEDDPPFTLDYWRLNISACKGSG